MHGNPEAHRLKVEAIARQVRERIGKNEPVHISKGGVRHVVPLPGDLRYRSQSIDISSLDEILEIDPERRLCTAEPGVPFSRLVPATLAHGLLPTVVPELEGITVGGAIAGGSVESMSFRYGGLHDSCVEYEIIGGSGEIVTCSPTQEPLLFDMIHGSYGTLGVLTRLSFKLVAAKPYVRMEYRTFPDAERFYAAMLERCEAGDFDFVDGIAHGPDRFVLCLGRFVEAAPYLSSYRWLNIYYKSTAERAEDYLTTEDYLFRYDAECHWLTRTIPPLEWKPVRFALGKAVLGSTNLIRWSKRLDKLLGMKKRPDVVCDVFIPARGFASFIQWYQRDFRFWPLWVVPYRVPAAYPWVAEEQVGRIGGDLLIDCAVYGKPNGEEVDYSKLLEDKTFELGGIKTLISRNHYTAERFWQIYNRPNYEAAKARLDPNGVFPGLFEKFHRVG